MLKDGVRASKVRSCELESSRIAHFGHEVSGKPLYYQDVIRSTRYQCKHLPGTVFGASSPISTEDDLG